MVVPVILSVTVPLAGVNKLVLCCRVCILLPGKATSQSHHETLMILDGIGETVIYHSVR